MSPALVFLIGPRGSGKSSVAATLAELIGWRWIDADAELESRCGRSIREVFQTEGEDGFRQHEATVLAELCLRECVVIATGGGCVLREDNRQRLKQGFVVWLTADPLTLWRRISQDPLTAERRPALTGADGQAEVAELVRAREPLYRACADVVLDTSEHSPAEIARMIAARLPQSSTTGGVDPPSRSE